MSMLQVEKLGAAESLAVYQALARLHRQAIHDGVLPLLGDDCLGRLYRAMARMPQAGVWVARNAPAAPIAGFLAGALGVSSVYRQVLIYHSWEILPRLAGQFWKPALLSRLSSLALYPFRQKQAQGPLAELLALAVAPDFQRQGIGHALVEAWETQLRQWGQPRYQVTTNRTEVGANRFYQQLGCVGSGQMPHHQMILQRYIKELA